MQTNLGRLVLEFRVKVATRPGLPLAKKGISEGASGGGGVGAGEQGQPRWSGPRPSARLPMPESQKSGCGSGSGFVMGTCQCSPHSYGPKPEIP